MQSKVSMVMPCYNKEKFIGNMFDSILAQEWNNIELILVNDGSTDCTRDIIAEYEPKFRSRGYEVVIIDQENQGVSAAVRNGLMRVTGEYVCQIDADDELDPRYTSMMAGWLDENPDYDWVICDSFRLKDDSTLYIRTFPRSETFDHLIEKWILHQIHTTVWLHLVRTEYLRRCNVVELFYVGREGNQEPQYIFPLALGGGKIKYLREPLYIYEMREPETHRSHVNNLESAKKRYFGLINVLNEVINRMPLDDITKQRLRSMSELSCFMVIAKNSIWNFSTQEIAEAMENLLEKVLLYFTPSTTIETKFTYAFFLPWQFFAALENNILGILPEKNEVPTGRVIAWGALGKNARSLLPNLIGTFLEPTEFWDAEGDDKYIKKPDSSSLTEQDTVLILPSRMEAVSTICAALAGSGCRIIPFDDINFYVNALKFPEFYDGTISFVPEGL